VARVRKPMLGRAVSSALRVRARVQTVVGRENTVFVDFGPHKFRDCGTIERPDQKGSDQRHFGRSMRLKKAMNAAIIRPNDPQQSYEFQWIKRNSVHSQASRV